ncbi:MAG TPA: hypothetical protein VKL99_04360 [Candidatus Angelobacter sp.]|nr:hypothetical protein [Candidatus Angelobacter sp.]
METSHDETNENKAGIYEALAVINRGFEQIIGAIYKLQTLGVVFDEYVEAQEIRASEMWAKMNCHILTHIMESELDDQTHSAG